VKIFSLSLARHVGGSYEFVTLGGLRRLPNYPNQPRITSPGLTTGYSGSAGSVPFVSY